MSVRGNIYLVTQPIPFATTYFHNPSQPDPATFTPLVGGLVVLAAANAPYFIPSSSVRTETDSSGAFHLDASSANWHKQYVAVHRLLKYAEVFNYRVPIYGPIYRSEDFSLSSMDNRRLRIYVYCHELSNTKGLHQAQLTDAAQKLKDMANGEARRDNRSEPFEKISLYIQSNGVRANASGVFGSLESDVRLRPSTSSDLAKLIRVKLENFDVDMPGWDWFNRNILCKDEGEIEDAAHDMMNALFTAIGHEFREEIMKGLVAAAQPGLSEPQANLLRAWLNDQSTMTFEKIRFPVIDERRVGTYAFRVRTVAPDPCVGMPRQLYV